MRDRPILFSALMVRAILAGTKTQTRRVLKPQPFWVNLGDGQPNPMPPCPYGAPGDRLWVKETWRSTQSLDALSPSDIGKGAVNAGYSKPWAPVEYVADGRRLNWEDSFGPDAGKTRVSIHMPRWASRITLEVTGVRVERLCDISEEDAEAEGAAHRLAPGGDLAGAFDGCETPITYSAHFRDLWESINGAGSWAANPWVWVVTFKRLEAA